MTAGALSLGTCALGRALDSDGLPLDGGPALAGKRVAVELRVPRPYERTPVREPFWTGVRAIDGLLTFGRGARVGIFGSPGAGKSTLIESIVDGCSADAVILALVGERGREAQHWIERRDLRTTIVCATSDRSACERIRACVVALAHAAALRDRGLHVLVVLDSLARVANALRERATAAGESVGRAGYPPSVFSDMARILEVAGPIASGSITLVATVLNDGDDRDPVSDAARALLDGHLVLSDRLAREGRFPALDVVASASRTMKPVVGEEHEQDAARVRAALAILDRTADARSLGIEPVETAAVAAIAAEAHIERFLRTSTASKPAATLAALREVADTLEVSDGHQ
jgi:ATP synthase in type III secretion protein N